MEGKVIKTKKGLFLRKENDFGALVFSPYSGLFFAIAKDYVEDTLLFCNEQKTTLMLPDEIIRSLNIGLDLTAKNFEIQTHWLPNRASFPDGFPDNSFVINWLISNKCLFKCNYCYASDVINRKFEMVDVKKTAESILELQPLAIVLCGGEPLIEKEKMIDALNILGGKVGIIVDTNGYNYDEELTDLFVKYKVVVRVSLDTLQNDLTQKIRPLNDKKKDNNILDDIVSNIVKYRNKKIPVLIHTVVSSVNKNSLVDLYDKLPKLGVNGWRIFSVINPNDEDRKESFDEMMTFRFVKTLKEAQEDIKKKMEYLRNSHKSKSNFSLQVVSTTDGSKNSVILVLPNGRFVTESLNRNEKTEINMNDIFSKDIVSRKEHYERYLGKI